MFSVRRHESMHKKHLEEYITYGKNLTNINYYFIITISQMTWTQIINLVFSSANY